MKKSFLCAVTAIGLLGLYVAAKSFVSVVNYPDPVTAAAASVASHNATTEPKDDDDLIPDYEFICWFLPRWVCGNSA
ncbi:hypothetical protein ACWGS9_23460 [Bradyrhizobium sp. Arg314]